MCYKGGVVLSMVREVKLFTRKMAEELQGDYIPRGPRISYEEWKKLKFRRAKPDEIHRCAMEVGNDIQSGPIYCGAIAEYVAFPAGSEGMGVAALCKRHPPKILIRDCDTENGDTR